MATPISINDTQFEAEVLKSPLPVVLDFWAPWCGPCRMVGPMLETLAEQMDGQVRFVKINVDENPQNASRFGVQGIPTLLFFRGGNLVDTVVGALPETALRDRIESTFEMQADKN